MNPNKKALLLSISFSVLFYLTDSIIDSTTIYKSMTFWEVLIINPPYQELYSRLLGVALIMVLAIIIPSFFDNRNPIASLVRNDKNISSDPHLMVNLSNQLRTPLNAIQGFIELLHDPQTTETSRRLYVNHIKTSSNYMLELVNNIADITLIESEGLFLKEEDCKLNIVLNQLHEKYTEKLKDKNKSDIDFILKRGNTDENLTLLLDTQRLKQVLENLLENSIAFTTAGKIEFGFRCLENDLYEFYVTDSGSGLSAERIDLIYNQFNSVIDNRMTPFDIVSLRINLAKHLVSIMGGKLIASSKPREGSDFSFRLKVNITEHLVIETMPEKKVARIEVPEINNKWADKTILIAEDVETNFIYLREILIDTGIQIIWAANGKLACQYALSNPKIDIILMDILMPEMDGIEATKIIKKELPEIPIIAQTAYHLDEKDYDEAMQLFSKYLIKPIWSNDLMQALTDFLPSN